MYKSPKPRQPPSAAGVLVICLTLGTALLAVLTLRGDVGKPVEQSAAPAADWPTPRAALSTMAAPFTDGHIQFVLQSIEPLEAPGAPAEPIQVIVVGLTNTGTSPQVVSFNDQRLLGDQGREFSPDPVVLAQLNNGKEAVLLPPGGTATMRIPFALPINTESVAVAHHAGTHVPGAAVPAR